MQHPLEVSDSVLVSPNRPGITSLSPMTDTLHLWTNRIRLLCNPAFGYLRTTKTDGIQKRKFASRYANTDSDRQLTTKNDEEASNNWFWNHDENRHPLADQ